MCKEALELIGESKTTDFSDEYSWVTCDQDVDGAGRQKKIPLQMLCESIHQSGKLALMGMMWARPAGIFGEARYAEACARKRPCALLHCCPWLCFQIFV